jgi:hypothetical protein
LRAALLAVLLLLTPVAASAEETITVSAKRLTLNPEGRNQTTVGRLRWRGGFALTADAEGFGGLSDLLLTPDGRGLLAVSDEGRWFGAELIYDAAGDLSGIAKARLGPMHDTAGRLLSVSIKRRQDAEALARLPDGSLVVAFERTHRLRRFAAGLGGPTEVFDAPPGLEELSLNAGIEAMVTLVDGRLLAFAEGQQDDGSGAAWLRETQGSWHALSLRPGGLFRPTGAALLPSGDVLLLERRYTLLGGLGARVSRIAAADIRAGARLEAKTLADFAPPLTLDNFEGIAAHRAGDGTTRITLISDDNFSVLQRTLLMQFELLEGE